MKIAFIGFGEVGRTCAATLREAGAVVDAAYDILFASGGTEIEKEAERLNVKACRENAEAIAGADWVVSAVTASSSLDAAEAAAPHLASGQVFVDLNSVSPGRKRAAAERVAKAGAVYVDMAVMAPIKPRGHRTPALLSGAGVSSMAETFDGLGFNYEIVSEEVGDAAAVKMVRSIFVKGVEAVMVDFLLAASLSGTLERVMTSLQETYPGLDWSVLPAYNLERMATHGIRRAAEMRESAATVAELGLDPGLVAAVAESQQRIGELGLAGLSGDLKDDVTRTLEALDPTSE